MLFDTTVSIAVVVCVLLLIGGSLWYRRHNALRKEPVIDWSEDVHPNTAADYQAVEDAVARGIEGPGYSTAEEASSSGIDGYSTAEEMLV